MEELENLEKHLLQNFRVGRENNQKTLGLLKPGLHCFFDKGH